MVDILTCAPVRQCFAGTYAPFPGTGTVSGRSGSIEVRLGKTGEVWGMLASESISARTYWTTNEYVRAVQYRVHVFAPKHPGKASVPGYGSGDRSRVRRATASMATRMALSAKGSGESEGQRSQRMSRGIELRVHSLSLFFE